MDSYTVWPTGGLRLNRLQVHVAASEGHVLTLIMGSSVISGLATPVPGY